MARKIVQSKASRTAPHKSSKQVAPKLVKTAVKRAVTKSPAVAPAKTLKRSALPDKKAATPVKKPGVIEKKPAITGKPVAGKGKPELGRKKALAGVRTGVGSSAAKVVAPKPKKPRAKKAPPRMRVRWCVYDGMMKPVAMFDYNQRKEAEASLAQYLQKKPTYFLQPFKEPMPVAPEPPEAG